MRKKRFLVINPNATEAMTQSIFAVAKAAAAPDMEIACATNHEGPPAIEGPEDGDAAIPGVLKTIRDAPEHDGYLIACFDDTGLAEARAATDKPVVGIGEASFIAAAAKGPFCIVTTVPEAEAVIAGNVASAGLAGRCKSIKAAGIAVLDLEFRPREAVGKVAAEITRQCEANDVSVAVLGCAGMGGVLGAISERVDAELVEPVSSGLSLLNIRQHQRSPV